MARKAREIFKARGFSDAELDAMPILQDPRFCKALEDEDEALQGRITKMQTDLDATTEWYNNTALPAIEKARKDAVAAQAERARLEAQLKAETEYGLRRVAGQDGGDGGAGGGGNGDGGRGGNGNGGNGSGDPDPRYVDRDTFQTVTDQFGSAIAMATDIAEDHRDLFGKRLPGGVQTLRNEYKEAVTKKRFQGTLRDYWENKYNVEQRRTEVANKEREDHERKIAEEAVAKYKETQGNPFTRAPEASRNPFTRKGIAPSQGADGKQPWEVGNQAQRSTARVMKFSKQVAAAS